MASIRELLGVELPVIQAPMAGVQGSALAIAVSNAGGLGSLPCATLSLDALRAELSAITSGTSRSFNVNFFCHTSPHSNPEGEAAWRNVLRPYYDELGVDLSSAPSNVVLPPFSHETADALRAFRPRVVSFHFGLPSSDLLARVRSFGAKVISSATTVDEARWLESQGVDAIIAQGVEAGGHRGMFLSDDLATQTGTLALVPQIVKAVRVPVIAAGGIGNAADVAAALAVGAAAVQVGTAYMLCVEATTGGLHRAMLESSAARQTALTNVFTGRPARAIVNRIIEEIGPINAVAPQFPLAVGAMLPLRAAAEARGSPDFSPLWSGQNVSGCKPVSASELTRDLMSGATS
jgi:nitronate monooxygenase